MEVMMLNFGAAAGHLEFGPNKNISSTCQAMRRRPIDLWEFPICQRSRQHIRSCQPACFSRPLPFSRNYQSLDENMGNIITNPKHFNGAFEEETHTNYRLGHGCKSDD